MKKSTVQKIQDIIKQENQDTHTLIAACDANDNTTISLQGKSGKVAEALYVVMHSTEHADLGKELYLMVKNIVYNIINNHSPMADDMIDMFLQTINNNDIQPKRPTIPLITQGEA